MRIKVQITLESGGGEAETVEVARLERASLRLDALGLSLAEARAILASLEQTL
ncbi:MAG: ISKra4 family transposase, partial [Verrucomicrobia bacterium]|nr:ISKra4 family transposase [Verrucomicrobiota bacterium]